MTGGARRNLLEALALCASAAALYLLLPSADHHPDGIVNIAAMVERYGPLPWTAYLRGMLPPHILFDLSALALYKLLLLAGHAGRALYPLTAVLSVLAGLGVGLFYLALLRATDDRPAALLGASGLAISGGYWMHANNLEDIVPTIVLFILALYLALGAVRSNRQFPWALSGAVAGLAALAHNTSLVQAGAIVVLAWQRREGARLRALLFLGGLGVCFFSALKQLGGLFADVRGPVELLRWIFFIHDLGVWGNWKIDAPLLARTAAHALIHQRVAWTAWLGGALGLAAAGWALKRCLAERGAADRPAAPRLLALAGLVWIAPTLAFAGYWCAYDTEFIAPALPGLWLLIAAGASAAGGRRRAFRAGAAGLVCTLFLANLTLTALPLHDPQNVRELRMTENLRPHLAPHTLVITPMTCWVSVEAEYFIQDIEVLELGWLWLSMSGDQDEYVQAVTEQIDAALAAGRPVLLHTWPERDMPSWRRLGKFGANLDRLGPLFEGYSPTWEFALEGEGFFRLSREEHR